MISIFVSLKLRSELGKLLHNYWRGRKICVIFSRRSRGTRRFGADMNMTLVFHKPFSESTLVTGAGEKIYTGRQS